MPIAFDTRAARAAALVLSLLAVPAAAPAQPSPATATAALDVPYLPQTEALCGGAATAMIFRYWGDRHASVQQFAPLVDRDAGGIADSTLIDAIRDRHWTATRLEGSIDVLRSEIAAGRPPMILIEDRPQRYHYVVVVAVDEAGVAVHDPTWGPSRRFPAAKLQAAWKPTGFWTLRVTPSADRAAATAPSDQSPSSVSASPASPPAGGPSETRSASGCDQRLDAAIDEIAARGLSSADAILQPLIVECPDSAGPLRELAGVRFAEKSWSAASDLAEAALERDPDDRYAADVLASSRFMMNDFDGALRAWNRVGKPILDSVRIAGLRRTRYSLLAQALDLPPDQILTARAFRLARRRLESMPDLAATRIALRPDDEGYAVADVAVVEQATLPRTPVQWIAAGVQAGLEREVSANVPGPTGQGERWSASWGWWENRPRASMQFAAPRLSRPHGVWRVGMAWEAQTYGAETAAIREERLTGDIGMSTWLTPSLRASIASGFDRWTRMDGDSDRTLHLSAALEARLVDDRIAVQLLVGRWSGLGGAPGFGLAALDLTARNRHDPGPIVTIARAGLSAASAEAPLALWSGAGEGRSRAPLLRAHSLLHDGRIDGTVFGRRLAHATLEAQHWLRRPSIVRLGAALFADAAAAGDRAAFSHGHAFQTDVGVGLRVRVPGRAGLFRVDYARGLRDDARTWIVGWQAVE